MKHPSLFKFSSKHVSGWCQKKHLHGVFSRWPRTAFSKQLESKCLYILVYLYKKLLSGAGQNNSVKEANYLVLVNFFKVFQLNWRLWKFNYNSAFWYFHRQHWNTEIFQTILTLRVRLKLTFSQYEIIWEQNSKLIEWHSKSMSLA